MVIIKGLLIIAIIIVSIAILVNVFLQLLPFFGIELTDDNSNDEPEGIRTEVPIFHYCMSADIIEAFCVGSRIMPEWAFKDNVEIILSPEMKVIVHDGEDDLVAYENDFLLYRPQDGEMMVVPGSLFKSIYVPVVEYHRPFYKIPNLEKGE